MSIQEKPVQRYRSGNHIVDRHRRAARMLGFALAADAPDVWCSFGVVMSARLTAHERSSIATMILETLPDADLMAVFAATSRGAGFPVTPLDPENTSVDARLWATGATEVERKSYMLAAYLSLPKADRRTFAEFVAEDLK